LHIDFPTYSFDYTTRTLTGSVPTINDSIQIIFGDGGSLSGAAGSGIASGLSGVKSFPYKFNNLFSIDSLKPDGTVAITYNGKSLTVTAGENWFNNTSYTDSTIDCKVDISVTDRISNFGFLRRDQIVEGF
jgi:hypothetical protein